MREATSIAVSLPVLGELVWVWQRLLGSVMAVWLACAARWKLAWSRRRHGTPTGQYRQIKGRVKAVAIDRLQQLAVAVELPQQGTVPFEDGEPFEDLPRPGLGGEGSLLGAPQADEAPGAPVPAQALDPGAGNHTTNRKAQ